MQLSFDKDSEVHRVTVTLARDDVNDRQSVMLAAFNRRGMLIASSASMIGSMEEAELLPLLLSDVAYGWLYRGAKEATIFPMAAYRKARKALNERMSK